MIFLVGCIETPQKKEDPKNPPTQPPVITQPPPNTPGNVFNPNAVTLQEMVNKFGYLMSYYNIQSNDMIRPLSAVSIGFDSSLTPNGSGSYVIGLS